MPIAVEIVKHRGRYDVVVNGVQQANAQSVSLPPPTQSDTSTEDGSSYVYPILLSVRVEQGERYPERCDVVAMQQTVQPDATGEAVACGKSMSVEVRPAAAVLCRPTVLPYPMAATAPAYVTLHAYPMLYDAEAAFIAASDPDEAQKRLQRPPGAYAKKGSAGVRQYTEDHFLVNERVKTTLLDWIQNAQSASSVSDYYSERKKEAMKALTSSILKPPAAYKVTVKALTEAIRHIRDTRSGVSGSAQSISDLYKSGHKIASTLLWHLLTRSRAVDVTKYRKQRRLASEDGVYSVDEQRTHLETYESSDTTDSSELPRTHVTVSSVSSLVYTTTFYRVSIVEQSGALPSTIVIQTDAANARFAGDVALRRSAEYKECRDAQADLKRTIIAMPNAALEDDTAPAPLHADKKKFETEAESLRKLVEEKLTKQRQQERENDEKELDTLQAQLSRSAMLSGVVSALFGGTSVSSNVKRREKERRAALLRRKLKVKDPVAIRPNASILEMVALLAPGVWNSLLKNASRYTESYAKDTDLPYVYRAAQVDAFKRICDKLQDAEQQDVGAKTVEPEPDAAWLVRTLPAFVSLDRLQRVVPKQTTDGDEDVSECAAQKRRSIKELHSALERCSQLFDTDRKAQTIQLPHFYQFYELDRGLEPQGLWKLGMPIAQSMPASTMSASCLPSAYVVLADAIASEAGGRALGDSIARASGGKAQRGEHALQLAKLPMQHFSLQAASILAEVACMHYARCAKNRSARAMTHECLLDQVCQAATQDALAAALFLDGAYGPAESSAVVFRPECDDCIFALPQYLALALALRALSVLQDDQKLRRLRRMQIAHVRLVARALRKLCNLPFPIWLLPFVSSQTTFASVPSALRQQQPQASQADLRLRACRQSLQRVKLAIAALPPDKSNILGRAVCIVAAACAYPGVFAPGASTDDTVDLARLIEQVLESHADAGAIGQACASVDMRRTPLAASFLQERLAHFRINADADALSVAASGGDALLDAMQELSLSSAARGDAPRGGARAHAAYFIPYGVFGAGGCTAPMSVTLFEHPVWTRDLINVAAEDANNATPEDAADVAYVQFGATNDGSILHPSIVEVEEGRVRIFLCPVAEAVCMDATVDPMNIEVDAVLRVAHIGEEPSRRMMFNVERLVQAMLAASGSSLNAMGQTLVLRVKQEDSEDTRYFTAAACVASAMFDRMANTGTRVCVRGRSAERDAATLSAVHAMAASLSKAGVSAMPLGELCSVLTLLR